MRRLTIVFFLCLFILSACGVNEQIQSDSSSSVETVHQAVYPTPIGSSLPPTLSPTATVSIPSPTNQPTQLPAVVTPTNAPIPLPEFERVTTLNLQPLTGPNYLVGWSPDGSQILYTQIGDEQDMAEVYTINTTTGEQQLIDGAVLSGKQGSMGYYPEFAAPQWMDTCCDVILAKPKANDKQEILIVDNKGSIKSSLGMHARGLFSYNKGGKLVTIDSAGIRQSNGKRPNINVPDFANRDTLASFKSNHNGKGVYVLESKSIKVVDLEDSSRDWTISTKDLTQTQITRNNISLSSLRIQGTTWSPDGSKIAFWLSSSTIQELWIANSDGSNLQNIYLLEQSRGGLISWSPDNTMIAFTNVDTGTEPVTTLNVFVMSHNTAVMIDTGVYYNPIWDPSSRSIASTLDTNNSIAIYSIKK